MGFLNFGLKPIQPLLMTVRQKRDLNGRELQLAEPDKNPQWLNASR